MGKARENEPSRPVTSRTGKDGLKKQNWWSQGIEKPKRKESYLQRSCQQCQLHDPKESRNPESHPRHCPHAQICKSRESQLELSSSRTSRSSCFQARSPRTAHQNSTLATTPEKKTTGWMGSSGRDQGSGLCANQVLVEYITDQKLRQKPPLKMDTTKGTWQ